MYLSGLIFMNVSLLLNLALMYAILIGINIPASLLGLDFNDSTPRERLWFEPPGFVIPLAWFVLFFLLGIARYHVTQTTKSSMANWLLIALAVLCASYAYYTLGLAQITGLSALWYGLAGNILVIIFALVVAYKLSAVSTTAALLVVPVALWTTFATAIVVGEMRMQKNL
jgi:tryptophan-rich sensory protein